MDQNDGREDREGEHFDSEDPAADAGGLEHPAVREAVHQKVRKSPFLRLPST